MSNKLTQKQENFTQNLFMGLSQREAWIQAGYSSKYDDAFIDHNACVLAKSNKVETRLAELNKPIIKRIQASKEAKLKTLEDIYGHEPLPETITARDRIYAIAEHNKMQGDYAPEKHAFVGGVVIEVVYDDDRNKDKTEDSSPQLREASRPTPNGILTKQATDS